METRSGRGRRPGEATFSRLTGGVAAGAFERVGPALGDQGLEGLHVESIQLEHEFLVAFERLGVFTQVLAQREHALAQAAPGLIVEAFAPQ